MIDPKVQVDYDFACGWLAEYFLSEMPKLNTQQNRDSLARDLQEAAETWFEDHEARK